MSSNEHAARDRANAFRTEHDLGTRPLGDLFEFVHVALGCDALAIDANEVEHGLSMLDPESDRIVIVVATTPHPMRQRSSLAHEIGHVVANDLRAPTAPTPGSRSPAEIQADAFARHLLLPLPALHERFSQRVDEPDLVVQGPEGSPRLLAQVKRTRPASIGEPELAAVVQEFEVSPKLAAIQMKEAKLIRLRQCEEWGSLSTGSLAARYGWLSQYQAMSLAATQPRAPQTLMRRAVEGYRRGVVGLTELACWYGLPPEQLLERIGPPQEQLSAGTTAERADDLDEDTPLFPPGFGSRRMADE